MRVTLSYLICRNMIRTTKDVIVKSLDTERDSIRIVKVASLAQSCAGKKDTLVEGLDPAAALYSPVLSFSYFFVVFQQGIKCWVSSVWLYWDVPNYVKFPADKEIALPSSSRDPFLIEPNASSLFVFLTRSEYNKLFHSLQEKSIYSTRINWSIVDIIIPPEITRNWEKSGNFFYIPSDMLVWGEK